MELYVYDTRTNPKTAFPPYTQSLSDYANAALTAADRDLVLSLVQSIVALLPSDLLRWPGPGTVDALDGTIGIVNRGHFISLRVGITFTLEYVPETSVAKKINAAQRRELEVALGLLETIERRLDSIAGEAFVPSVTIAAGTGGMIRPGTPVTDFFTITNASDTTVAVTLDQAQISGPSGEFAPTGYTIDGNAATPPKLAELGGGGSTTIGVQYIVTSGNVDDPVTCTLLATIGSHNVNAEAHHTILSHPSVEITVKPAGEVVPGTSATDSFTVTNKSGQPACISIPNPPAINGPQGTIAADTYTFSIPGALPDQNFANFGALQSTLDATMRARPLRDGEDIVVGVSYIVPPGKSGQPVVNALAVNVAAGGLTASSIGMATSTTSPKPQLVVTAIPAGTVSPGATATDEFALKNNSGQSAAIAIANAPTIVSEGGRGVQPTGYTLEVDGKQLLARAKFEALKAQLAVLELHDGGSAKIGVQYIVPAGTDGEKIFDTLTGTVQAGCVRSDFTQKVVDVLASRSEAIGSLAKDLYAKREIWKSAQMSDPAAALRDLENYDKALVGLKEADFRVEDDDSESAEAMMAGLLAIHEMTSDGFEKVLASMRHADADEGSAI